MNKINGKQFKEIIHNGLNNLSLHCQEVNDLNVFPVPDGDTGTNMLMTLQNGYSAITDNEESDLSSVTKLFSKSVVLGARGNSGVILSQFLKGICHYVCDYQEINSLQLTNALKKGVDYAYKAVQIPVEGTMLTVVRESTEYVSKCIQGEKTASIEQVLELFIEQAKRSLDNTPNLLPVLKSAGVVDSGGAGLIYFFEGIIKSIKGEKIDDIHTSSNLTYVDYSFFNDHSTFSYGYCTELLIQLLSKKVRLDEFNLDNFTEVLGVFGNSIVTSLNDDKVKVHIHTKMPEKVLDYCHTFGEFLALKIENMDVQHDNIVQTPKHKEKFEVEDNTHHKLATVVVASDEKMAKQFKDMGATCIVYGGDTCNPSVNDFVKAYSKIDADNIIVFPNNSNVILTVKQSAKVFNKCNVVCIESTSYLECYSALTLIDYDLASVEENVSSVNDAIKNITSYLITHAIKDSNYENETIHQNDYIAVNGKHLLGVDNSIVNLTVKVSTDLIKKERKDIMTIFVGKDVLKDDLDVIINQIRQNVGLIDIDIIETDNRVHDLMISLE